MSKYEVFSGPYFTVFNPNTGKYGQEKTPYVDNFHEVLPSKRKLITRSQRNALQRNI